MGVDGGVGDAVHHNDFGRIALQRFGRDVRRFEQPAVHVRVDVDETRRNDLSRSVNRAAGSGGLEIADGGNRGALDADVGPKRRRLIAVDDGSPLDEQIEHVLGSVSNGSGDGNGRTRG